MTIPYVDPLLTIHALRKHGITVRNVPLDGIYQDHYETVAAEGMPPIPRRTRHEYPSPDAAEEIWRAWERDVDRGNAPLRERERTHTEAHARWLEYINSKGPYPLRKYLDGKEEWIAGWLDGRRG